MSTLTDVSHAQRTLAATLDRLTTHFEALVQGHRAIVQRHDALAVSMGRPSCTCWDCGIARAALRIASGEQE